MKLPHGESAVVDIRKIRNYCLSPEHPRGRHKAQVFQAALGMTAKDSGALSDALMRAAAENDATAGISDSYGNRYIIDFVLARDEKAAVIRSCWIILNGEMAPRFVSCYVL